MKLSMATMFKDSFSLTRNLRAIEGVRPVEPSNKFAVSLSRIRTDVEPVL